MTSEGSSNDTARDLSLGPARSAWRSARGETGAGEVVLRLVLDGARPGRAAATTDVDIDIAAPAGGEAAFVGATDLPFAASSIGLIGLVGPVDAIDAALIAECRRVLKSEGRLVILADADSDSSATPLTVLLTSTGFEVLTSVETVAVVVEGAAATTAIEHVRRVVLAATKEEGQELLGVVMSIAVHRGHGEGRELYVQPRQAPTDREPVWRGAWELPQGHVEPAEPVIGAAVRELLEETGMRARFASVVGVEEAQGLMIEHLQPSLATVVRGVSNYVAFLVLAEVEEVGSPRSPIAGPGCWVDRAELARLLREDDVYPPCRPMLNHILEGWPP